MSRTLWATTASALGLTLVLGLSACSDSNTPDDGDTISQAEANDIGEAMADETDQSAASLSIEAAAPDRAIGQSAARFSIAGSAPLGANCAVGADLTDSDGDGAPDDATFTFELPACSFTGFRGGTLEITGSVDVSDPTPNDAGFAYDATLHDLKFAYTSPIGNLTFTATRNGTRSLSGNATGAALSNNITVERTFPVRAAATADHNLLLTFTPEAGSSLELGAPLPSGTIVGSGTFTWTRGDLTRTFVVTTTTPLVWDATCITDRKVASGEIHATQSDGSYIKTVWSACGIDPVRTFVGVS